MPTVEVSERVDAPPARVWDLIRDPTAMAGLTAECSAMKWTKEFSAPAVGARFRGSNRSGWRRWSTTCTIVRYRPGEEIAWDVTSGPIAVAQWSYRIDDGGGSSSTIITEAFVDHRSPAFQIISPYLRGVRDTEARNRDNMAETLRRIKARAEV
ncbi:MAG: SRPBCC family protein [Acidimicrobiales bacterium]